MLVLENLLPKSNQLQIPQITPGTATQSEIGDGVLHVWEQSGYIVKMIPYVNVGLDPSKTYCLGFFGEIISGRYQIYGLGTSGYKDVISNNGAHYVTASGVTELQRIHIQTPRGDGEVYIKSLFLVEGDKPPSIWTPAHTDLTESQRALMRYGDYTEVMSI